MMHPALAVVLNPLPPVPSRVPIFKSVQSTDTDETTTTFSAVDIGTPHAKRIVVLIATYGVNAATSTSTVNGIAPFFRVQSGRYVMSAFQAPVGSTANIVLSIASSLHKRCSVYVAYPQIHTHRDTVTFNAAATAAVLSDISVQAGGFVIYGGGTPSNILATFTSTWTGADAVVEDEESIVEATEVFTSGHINNTVSSELDDLTCENGGLSATTSIIAASWGPSA